MTWVIKVSQRFGLTNLSENERRLALNLYDLPPSHAKQYVRNNLIDGVIDIIGHQGKGTVKMLTLPSAWWRFEKSLRRRIRRLRLPWRISFTSFERNPQIFKLASSMILTSNKPIKLKHSEECNTHVVSNGRDATLIGGDVHNYLSSDNNRGHSYRAMWLDLNSPYSERIRESISDLYNKWFVVGQPGIFALTVLCGRESLQISKKINEFGDRIGWIASDVKSLMGIDSSLIFKARHRTIKQTMCHLVFYLGVDE